MDDTNVQTQNNRGLRVMGLDGLPVVIPFFISFVDFQVP